MHVIYYLHIKVNTIKRNFHAKNITWLKFTINISLFKFNYNCQHCSSISLTKFMSVPKECVLGYRTGLQSSATGFLMPDQRHFLSLYSHSLIQPYRLVLSLWLFNPLWIQPSLALNLLLIPSLSIPRTSSFFNKSFSTFVSTLNWVKRTVSLISMQRCTSVFRVY